MNYGLIYKITNLMNNKIYIGKTTEFNEKKYFCGGQAINKAIKKYGKHNFKREILGYCSSLKELNEAEIECIYFFRSFGSDGVKPDNIYGYNLTAGGDGGIGRKVSKEAKEKNRLAHLGKVHTNEAKIQMSKSKMGKKLSEETRKKMSQAKTGQVPWNKGRTGVYSEESLSKMTGWHHTQESKQKMSVSKLGKKFTNQHKLNLSKSRKGILMPRGEFNKNSKEYLIITPDQKELKIKGIVSYCKENNLNAGCLIRVANGERKQHKGFTCKKIKEEETT